MPSAWRPDTDPDLYFEFEGDVGSRCVRATRDGEELPDPEDAFAKAIAFNNATNQAKGKKPNARVNRRIDEDGDLELEFVGLTDAEAAEVEAFLAGRYSRAPKVKGKNGVRKIAAKLRG